MNKKVFIIYNPPIVDYMPEAHKVLTNQIKNFTILDMLDVAGTGVDPKKEILRTKLKNIPKVRVLALDFIASLLQSVLKHKDDSYIVEVVNGAFESLEKCINKYGGIQSIKALFCSSMSATFPEMLRIFHIIASNNIPCVAGGIHVTVRPNDIAKYLKPYLANTKAPIAIVKGYCNESLMKIIVDDIFNNSLKEYYSMSDEMIKEGYWLKNTYFYKGNHFVRTVGVARGCPFDCEFCSISVIPKNLRKLQMRDPDDVVMEINSAWGADNPFQRLFRYIISEDIYGQHKYIKELLQKVIDQCRPFNFITQTDCLAALDEDFLKILKDAGCLNIVVGFESLSLKNLEFINKKSAFILIERLGISDIKKAYVEAIKRIQDKGINVVGAVILGLPFDKPGCGHELHDFFSENNIFPHPSLLTALPGAKYFEEKYKINLIYKHPDDWYDHKSPYPAAFSGMDFCETNLYFTTGLTPMQVHEEMHMGLSELKGYDTIKSSLNAFKNSYNNRDRKKVGRSLLRSFLSLISTYDVSKKNIDRDEDLINGTRFRPGILQRQKAISQLLKI